MNQKASAVVIELAKKLIDVSSQRNNDWEAAYYRFSFDKLQIDSTALYSVRGEGFFFDGFKCVGFYEDMEALSISLVKEVDKNKGLFLLVVRSDFTYEIKFEWTDLGKWKISKEDGQSGIPSDI
ncbi:hypothetical protein SFA35_12990 [Pseudomonas sp. HR96]|uniref:hypothetical protein n=1 Tax=Pseudomonas sp. HR96 TaxID=1027966 RepID=UPI002A75C242|nr:hypothetical protein [Pseudomonas sp. HR96]WPO97587.1 hypothetical protein SFA35_12990 [Pseudomonas sp. HR96]